MIYYTLIIKELAKYDIWIVNDETCEGYIFGKKIGEKNQIIIKNKATNGELIFLRELTKLWNLELGLMEKTQSIDLIYKKRY